MEPRDDHPRNYAAETFVQNAKTIARKQLVIQKNWESEKK